MDTSSNTHSLVDFEIIDAQTNAVKYAGLLQTPVGDYDYYYGSIAANANGDFVIGYDRSGDAATGASGDISSYAEVCHFDGTTATCENPLLLSQGSVNNYHLFGGNGERWGDYSAASIDPNDPNSFWVFTSVARGSTNWGTQISQITLGSTATPEPATYALGGAALVLLGAVRRRANATGRNRKSCTKG